MYSLITSAINLGILIWIIARYTKAPIRQFIQARHETLRDELERTAKDLATAKKRYEEFSSRLSAMGAEVASLRQQSKQDSQSAKQRIIDEANRLSAVIVSDAKASSEGLFGDLKRQMRGEFAERVVARAEALLRARLTGEDQVRLREEFARQLGGVR